MPILAVLVYAIILLTGVFVWLAMGASLGALAVVMVVGSFLVSAVLSGAALVCVVVSSISWLVRKREIQSQRIVLVKKFTR